MLDESIREQARGLRIKGLTCRAVVRAMQGRISKSAVHRIWPSGTRPRPCKTFLDA
ncbi:MAG: hypothetical protein ACLQLG_18690 [Thermoguttaceae bacterium]